MPDPLNIDFELDRLLNRFSGSTFNALTGLQPRTFAYLWRKYCPRSLPQSPIRVPYVIVSFFWLFVD